MPLNERATQEQSSAIASAIGLNGWWYVGRINGDYGQAVSYSKDQGKTWKRVKVGQGPAAGIGLLDKNHLCIDNSPASPFKGYLYDAWTNFIPGHADTNQVELVRSTDQGLTWSSPLNISSAASALKLNHGVNLQSGPGGVNTGSVACRSATDNNYIVIILR